MISKWYGVSTACGAKLDMLTKDTQGPIHGVFRTQKDALRFALLEVAGDSACVRVLPRTGALADFVLVLVDGCLH